MQKKPDNLRNPYKGLYPYQEEDNSFFYGRKTEIEDLFLLIKNSILCVVCGKAGIGKTSLLKAGLFPTLKKNGFLPVWVRIRYLSSESCLLEQVRATVSKKIKSTNIQEKEGGRIVCGFRKDESLWEYFRRVRLVEKNSDNTITPVLVFDQFEELFTLGKYHPQKDDFIQHLHYLIEGQFPESIKNLYFQNKELPSYLVNEANCRLVFSLREDYLPHLNDMVNHYEIHPLGRNIFWVHHMNGQQAREVINIPGGLSDETLTVDILELFYPRGEHINQQIPDEKLEIEPSYLSLLCHQIFEKRKIGLSNHRSYDKILINFYESEIREFPAEVAKFIESKLLTEGGFRLAYPLESNHPLKKHLEKLVNRRILRKVYTNEKEYIEIVHDVLAPVIREKRNRRGKKKKNKIIAVLSVLLVVFGLLTLFAFSQKSKAEMNRLAAEALAELPKDNTKALRIAEAAYKMGLPNPPARTCRVLSNIGYSSFEEPFYNILLRHDSSINAAVFSPNGSKILFALENGTAKLFDLRRDKVEMELKGHSSRIISAAFSPDGSKILTASWDKSAKLWNIKGKLLREFRHDRVVSKAIFSADGLKILTASWDNSVKLWDLRGELLKEFKHKGVISDALFSPDRTKILTASWDKRVRLWNLEGALLMEFKHNDAVSSALFSPDRTKILTASWDKSARLWNLKGTLLMEFKHDGAVSSALFSSDGLKILTASDDGTAKLWNLKGVLLADLNKHKKSVVSALFSPDGNRIITASKDKTARIWDLEGNLLANLNKHKSEVNLALFFPDGRRVITADKEGIAKEWCLESNLLVSLDKHETVVCSALFSFDNRYILTTSDDETAKLWDLDGNLLVDIKHNEKVSSAVFSPNSKQILTASWDGTAKLWDMKGNLLNDSFKHNKKVLSAVFSPDGSKILTASADRTAKIWCLNGEILQHLKEHGAALTCAKFSPDGQWIVTASEDGYAKVWDKKGNHKVDLKHDGIVTSVEISVYGQILTASKEGTAKLWNLNGILISDLNTYRGVINSAVFSPDGERIVTSYDDGMVKVWNREGNPLIPCIKHNKAGFYAEFSPNGEQIVTASDDGTAKLWNLEGNLLADLNKHNGVVNLAVFSPDGERIVTTSSDKTAKVWRTPKAIFNWLRERKIEILSEADIKNFGIHYNKVAGCVQYE